MIYNIDIGILVLDLVVNYSKNYIKSNSNLIKKIAYTVKLKKYFQTL